MTIEDANTDKEKHAAEEAEAHSAPSNGAAGEQTPAATTMMAPPLPEGSVKVSEEDAATISAAHQAIFNAQQGLGRVREQYMLDENANLNAITEARQSLDGVLLTLAQKHGIDIKSEPWTFLAQAKAFVPRPKQ